MSHLRPYLIPVYFTLGGLAGGLLFFGGLAPLWHLGALDAAPRVRDLAVIPLLLTSALILTADLTHPLRFFRLLLTFRASSAVSWGSWILTGSGLMAALELLGFPSRAVHVAACAFGIGLSGYTGVLLTASSRLRWYATPLYGAIFLSTGFTSAAAVLAAASGPEHALARTLFALALGAIAAALMRRHLHALATEAAQGRLEPALPEHSRRWLERAVLAATVAAIVPLFQATWLFAAATLTADLCLRFAAFWMEEGPAPPPPPVVRSPA